VGWDYRLFLVSNYGNKLIEAINTHININKSNEYITRINNFLHLIQNLIEIFNLKKLSTSQLLALDLEMINLINEKDKRNYHLWKYIIHLSNFYTTFDDQMLIFCFCLHQFINDPLDYSAYSNIRTLIKRHHSIINESKTSKAMLSYMDKLISTYKEKMNTVYFHELYGIFQSIK
jgi:hypothetical protein